MDATASRRVFGGRGRRWPTTGLLAALVLVGILVQGCSDNNGRVTGTESKVTGDAIGGNIKTSVTINPGTVDRGRRASVVVSLGLESAQLLLAIGQFDVDDLILNAGGALLGYFLYRLLAASPRPHAAVRTDGGAV